MLTHYWAAREQQATSEAHQALRSSSKPQPRGSRNMFMVHITASRLAWYASPPDFVVHLNSQRAQVWGWLRCSSAGS